MTDPAPPFDRFLQYRYHQGLRFDPRGELYYTMDLSGTYNLWHQPVDARGAPGYPAMLTGWTDRAVREFAFADDRRSVFYSADTDGDENYQLYRLWLRDGRTETLTNDPKVRHVLPSEPVSVRGAELLYCDNGRDASEFDVVVRHLRTGAVSRPFPTGAYWDHPRFDPTHRRILAHRENSASDTRAFLLDRKRGTVVEVLPHAGDALVVPIDFTSDGRGILLITDLDSDFLGLVVNFPATGETQVIARPRADIEEAAYSRRTGTLAYSANVDGYSTLYAGRIGAKFARLRVPKGAIPFDLWGQRFVLSADGKFLAVLLGDGAAPPEVLRIPLGRGTPDHLTESLVGGVPDAPLPRPKFVRVPAPDGRFVPCLFYAPKRRPSGPMPAVLSIHGGPHLQERPGWQYGGLYQFLNSRGIAVLSPNFRGSLGYGKRYRELLYRDWGGVDLEDYRACAEWLRHRSDVDRSRLAVFGGSYGGFATLSCLTRLPEYWAVGVDVFGPSNLVTFLQSVPPSWRPITDKMVGDPERDRDFLLARSPITYLDKLRVDLMVVQGAKDPRVVKGESDQLVERLRSMGRTVKYLVFEDEGHGFTHRSNTVRVSKEVSEFLIDHLLPTP